MLQKLRQSKREQGFTIIEVLIVLAIAGLILLIVFLAVPALQRNSRNTTLKNDVSAVLATVNEFENDNNGQMPTSVTAANGTVTVSSTVAGTTAVTGKVQGGTAVSTGTTAPTATDTIVVALNYACNGNALGTATNRSIAALYNVESGSGNIAQCQAS